MFISNQLQHIFIHVYSVHSNTKWHGCGYRLLTACCWHMCVRSSYFANNFFNQNGKRKKKNAHTNQRNRSEIERERGVLLRSCVLSGIFWHILHRKKKYTMPVPVHFIRCNRFECWMLNHFFFFLDFLCRAFFLELYCTVRDCFVLFERNEYFHNYYWFFFCIFT